jgi:adenylate cyclase
LNGEVVSKQLIRTQTLNLFEQAVDFYQSQQFESAINLFRQIMAMDPDDFTALIFIEKATQYLYHGVPENWSGAVEMQIK